MKRIVGIVFAMICLVPANVAAQKFQVTYDAHMRTDDHRQESCSDRNRIEVRTSINSWVTGGSTYFSQHLTNSINDGKWWIPGTVTREFTGVNPVTYIQINGYHWDNPTVGGCEQRGSHHGEAYIAASDYPCVSKSISGGFMGKHDDGSYMDIRIVPVNRGTPLSFTTAGAVVFPSDDTVSIKSAQPCNNYQWEYSINGVSYSVSTKLGSSEKFTLSAKELLGADIFSYVGKNIFFQAKYLCNNAYTEIFSLPVTLSAPHIDSVAYQLPTCHKEEDARLFVYLDRELYENEKLYISTQGDRFVENKTTAGTGSRIIEIGGLPADTFNISLLGTYRFGTNLADTINTYTDGVKHKYSIRIPERPALSMTSIYEAPVHCHNGKDGKIFVQAAGGNGIYDAFLTQEGGRLDSIRFAGNETGVFEELYAGLYRVYIQDSNGCTLDAAGDPVTGAMTVSQPADSVIILSHYSEEPKGFGLSNGWAQITFRGGTGTDYQAVWKDSLNVVVPNVITREGDTYVSKAENIWSSTYFVTVYDANYPLSDPRTEENLCGCTDTIRFFVEEPPKLEVVVDEYHYVTCFGDNDGEIVAHAWGGRPHTSGLPYTYDWEEVDGSSAVPVLQSDSIITGLYSGYYRVKITDRNDIFTYSDVYRLVQPDLLTVTTRVLQQISCSGDSIGALEATAAGGTPPYSYIWTTNDTTRAISGLPQGMYVVGVRDARYEENILGHYCFAQAYDSIVSPSGIRLNAKVTEPLCYGYADGKIVLSVTGGVTPYTYRWSDGPTSSQRTGLSEGEYRVRVEDANGCSMEEAYLLSWPEPVVVSLGGDITLCKGQTVTIDGELGTPDMAYSWTDAAQQVVSAHARFDAARPGVYRMTATNAAGCFGWDELEVFASEDEVRADFIIATRVADNAHVHAVNITPNVVDSVHWIIPEGISVVHKEEGRIELVFPERGDFVIGMVAHKNDCKDILYKTVAVVDKSELGEDESEEPFIKRFVVSPNPNDGTFQVVVELREEADYTLQLYDSSGKLVETKQVFNRLYESTRFDVSHAGKGAFFLRFVSAKASSVFHVIIH